MPNQLLILAAGVLAFMAIVGWWLTRKQRRQSRPGTSLVTVRVEELGDRNPPSSPQLMVHHTPVWLAGVVLAPAGRDRALPNEQTAPAIADFAVPGLKEVMLQHRTRVFVWPAQVSAKGFVQAFARHTSLPGDFGKGSPWCTVAGSFRMHGVGYVMGLICRASRPNNHGQIAVPPEADWLDIVQATGG